MTSNDRKTKTVYLIRHAESEENRRLASLKLILTSLLVPWRGSWPSYQDVTSSLELLRIEAQLDSDLSPHGFKQVELMGEKLRSDRFLEKKNIKLIVHSPLQRARKTCHGVLGFVAPEIESKDTDNSFELSTAGDKGRVVQLDALKERTPKEWLPFSKESYEGRIKSVVQWLIRQEEDVVAVVGHSQFFKTMLGLDYKFGNCDVYEVILDHTGDMDNDAHNMDERNIHGWRDLKQLYSL